ncbi:MAG: RtcB family protein [Thermodesulfobacteriota bacterium]
MKINRISEYTWEIPKGEKEGMLVPARMFATETLMKDMDEGVFEQITNVAALPGIVGAALCMPDGHRGYGFPIGGVAAFRTDKGVISPGGIGFDINCGVTLLKTDITVDEVQPKIRKLVDRLFVSVPTGVGASGLIKLSKGEFKDVMVKGVDWCIEKGYGLKEDRDRIESLGCINGADPSKVGDRAIERGVKQLGTLGSGNHYLEIQVADPDKIYDKETARVFGIERKGQVLIMIHCGSRGFGHQVGTDYLRSFEGAMKRYGITVRDRELVCAPFHSHEGQAYYKAMLCAANMAFANRLMIVHRIREVFSDIFKRDPADLGMDIVYDVAHNIAKIERYKVKGREMELLVHRKGATRSFGPNHREIPEKYKKVGQPVLLGGSMETGSYLLAGTDKASVETFGSTSHGAGRVMSRHAAKKKVRGAELKKAMEAKGIFVKAASMSGLAEEAGLAYKDIDDVVEAIDCIGISRKVARLRPIGNIKG